MLSVTLQMDFDTTEFCIRTLSETHQKIYIMLIRKQDINQISSELNIELINLDYLIKEIYFILYTNNKGHLISDNILKKSPFNNNNENIDNDIVVEIHNNQLSPDDLEQFQNIYNTICETFTCLSKSEKRCMFRHSAGRLGTICFQTRCIVFDFAGGLGAICFHKR